jgi:hypothetical protein
MKAILEFDLNEDRLDYEDSVNGPKYRDVLRYLDNWLREQVKYSSDDVSSDTIQAYDKCRNMMREILEENGLSAEILYRG